MAMASQQLDVYQEGIQAWFTDDAQGWVSASLVTKSVDDTSVSLVFQDDCDAERKHVYEASLKSIDSGATPLPPLRNPIKIESTNDLTSLSYLNEPSVLQTIRIRYDNRTIYTYSGIVLIATNPFDRVALYEPEIIQRYSGSRRGDLDPHLFAIAEDAYRCMIREHQNQTIIVSGESGAGKTVSAKYIMRYFATADDKEATSKVAKEQHGMTEVEMKILATNPIMEAFGNAKTTRNDNSSRFGKYIEIQFDKSCNIVGAKIKTYLLERSRLIFQPETERNYHIFYQLCSGSSPEQIEALGLTQWTDYHFLNQSGTGSIPDVDDAVEFKVTQEALAKIGIDATLQKDLFQVLAALLHMGNIDITGRNDAMVAEDDASLHMACKLLGISASDFRKWIVRRQITTRSEKIITNLSPVQAQVVRDSVAKYIYSSLFDWLVSIINDTLSCSSPEDVSTFIGVLDIYGFEHFKKNSFEQFCINYANEKLQQQFNQHVFKLEQEEYVREEIDWKFISFSDNQKCIEMIEAKMGILSLLDEESRLPSGTDQGFCTKLYQTFGTANHTDYFKKPRFSNSAFTVVHYAHDVEYDSEGFMDKNKETVPDEHLALLHGAQFQFLVDMIQTVSQVDLDTPSGASAKRNSVIKKPTLGSIFKLSLINLMDTIGQTNVHYIRCIKPNEAKAAWQFEPNMVLAQLRACGVLETIRISCAGYPTRWTFADFVDRYYMLVTPDHWYPLAKADQKQLCHIILEKHVQDKDRYQIGLTKLFFRAGQLAYLEKARTDRLSDVAVLLQKNTRRFLAHRRYQRTRAFIVQLQQVARQKHAQAALQQLRFNQAATVLQSYWRMYIVRRAYLARRAFVIQLQAAVRVHLAKHEFAQLRKHHAATQIQRVVRGHFVRRDYQAKRNAIIQWQTGIRGRLGRKQLTVVKAEARSVSHFKDVSYKLESRVQELMVRLDKQKDEKKNLRAQTEDLTSQVRQWIASYDSVERQAKQLSDQHQQVTNGTSWSNDRWKQWYDEHQHLERDYFASLDKIKLQDKEIERLRDELSLQRHEMTKLRDTSQSAMQSLTDVPNLAELRDQISALKNQLSMSLARPARLPSPSSAAGTVPADAVSPSTSSSSSVLHSLQVQDPRNNDNALSATSIDTHASPELESLLLGEQTLHQELIESLIRTSSHDDHADAVPAPPANDDPVLPAHLFYQCLSLMWKLGHLQPAQQFLSHFMEAIAKECQDHPTLSNSLYWLSNAHELLSLAFAIQPQVSTSLQPAVNKANTRLKYEAQRVECDLFVLIVKDTQQSLSKIAVPAVVESQTLPGFVATDTGRMFSSQSVYTMADLLAYFDKVLADMNTLGLQLSVKEQCLQQMVKYIGVTCFNDLLGRRHYNSWKRAMQIQYNLGQLEDWCKENQFPDVIVELEHISQATKLLQLKKATLDDLDIIYDVCWILLPGQIHKLLQSYHIADYEEPISHEILRSVSAKANDNKQLLLNTVVLDQTLFEIPDSRSVSLPRLTAKSLKMDLPHTRHLLTLVETEQLL
ncbi:hypothetical protein DM01DRAFT_1331734 [Hesseltinella vesiculosa]|uniref:Myosin-2 n=1 Tax=Hesseltinella vesiculosa TaxID=101127 RepID=A0A1X2GW74_9FUNG|nr:hypothetical protein DM01DRAFT_1331734 [Hesseltinella vesiculosa]